MLQIFADIVLDDGSHGFFDFGCVSEELSPWYAYGGTCFLECEELPELSFVAEAYGPFVVSSGTVFLPSEGVG